MKEGLIMSGPPYQQNIGKSTRLRLWPEVQNPPRPARHNKPKNHMPTTKTAIASPNSSSLTKPKTPAADPYIE